MPRDTQNKTRKLDDQHDDTDVKDNWKHEMLNLWEEKNAFIPLHLSSWHIVWKLLKMSHLNFWILAFSTNFCPIKNDLSGNTVWPQALGFQKVAKMDHFWHF